MSRKGFNRSRLSGAALVLLAPLALDACGSVVPKPMTASEQAERARHDREVLMSDDHPLTQPLNVEEAVARALKYNYDDEGSRNLRQTLQEKSARSRARRKCCRAWRRRWANSWRNNDNAAQSIDELTRPFNPWIIPTPRNQPWKRRVAAIVLERTGCRRRLLSGETTRLARAGRGGAPPQGDRQHRCSVGVQEAYGASARPKRCCRSWIRLMARAKSTLDASREFSPRAGLQPQPRRPWIISIVCCGGE